MLHSIASVSVRRGILNAAVISAAVCAGAQSASADVIYQTNGPFGGWLGLNGMDIFTEQSVALRFTPTAEFTLDRVSLWFMNNDGDGGHPLVTITLRTDNNAGGNSIPGGTIIEQWQFNVSAVGWDPQLEALNSTLHPTLHAGQHYWIMAQSNVGPFIDGVWCFASEGTGMMSICNGIPCEWSNAAESGVAAGIIEGTPIPPACAADVDGNDQVDVIDLLAVINAWGACATCPTTPCAADVAPETADCTINVLDLLAVINGWGPCS